MWPVHRRSMPVLRLFLSDLDILGRSRPKCVTGRAQMAAGFEALDALDLRIPLRGHTTLRARTSALSGKNIVFCDIWPGRRKCLAAREFLG